MKNVFDVISFGAVADGVTDDTKAIQSAIDAAGKVQGKVYLPSGVYKCGYLKMAPYTTIEGEASWTYRQNGGTILSLNDDKAPCLLDISDAHGCSIRTLCMDGNKLGDCVHGIATLREDDAPLDKFEDTTLIDGCRISCFSGDGVHMQRIWCFSIRHSQLVFNKKNGLYMNGWDAFLVDNWFSNNEENGICSDKTMCAMIISSNRMECNLKAGLKAINAIGLTINGNQFDANGGPGIDMQNPKGARVTDICIVGNSFTGSGRSYYGRTDCGESCHVHLERAMALVMQSNYLLQGYEEATDALCPKTGIIIKKLKECIIKDNAMYNCATDNVYIDLGEHEGGNVIDIKGTLRKSRGTDFTSPFFED